MGSGPSNESVRLLGGLKQMPFNNKGRNVHHAPRSQAFDGGDTRQPRPPAAAPSQSNQGRLQTDETPQQPFPPSNGTDFPSLANAYRVAAAPAPIPSTALVLCSSFRSCLPPDVRLHNGIIMRPPVRPINHPAADAAAAAAACVVPWPIPFAPALDAPACGPHASLFAPSSVGCANVMSPL